MFVFILVVITLIGILLTAVILLQSGQGGGLAGIASGGSTQQVLGARQAPDVLEKGTWTLATIFILLCLFSNFTIDRGDEQEGVIQQRGVNEQTTEPGTPLLPPADNQGAPPAQPPAESPAPEGE